MVDLVSQDIFRKFTPVRTVRWSSRAESVSGWSRRREGESRRAFEPERPTANEDLPRRSRRKAVDQHVPAHVTKARYAVRRRRLELASRLKARAAAYGQPS